MNPLMFGLGWETTCDIDSSIILMNENSEVLETISFRRKRGTNDCVIHFGDNLTGEGEGDDEVIQINLDLIPANCHTIWLTVTVFT